MTPSPSSITVNERQYAWPKQPVVVVCIDGSEPDYIVEAVKAGAMPWMKQILESQGSDLRADCVVPSFTNPNNMSIVTGVPPRIHGICGNFYYDRENDVEVMMNEPSLLRTPTIFKAFQDAGAKVAIVTAKDKLRRLLGNELVFGKDGAICFSSEKSDQATVDDNGIDNVVEMVGMEVPSVYSAELSEFIFNAGVKIMETVRPDIMYLSTTDYIQHKFAPGSEGANRFYAMMDSYWSQLHDLGAIIGLTADHGMNAKHNDEGDPNVIYLQDKVDELLGEGIGRVILPITDPYVVHHGALGSFATVYLPDDIDEAATLESLSKIPGIESALTNAQACDKFLLAPDRVGDLVLVSEINTVIGTSADRHDLSGLEVPLRSHGGMSEQTVPLIFNRKIINLPERTLRNFDVFDLALNHAAA
jgi:phosphonoacetate hydrolase